MLRDPKLWTALVAFGLAGWLIVPRMLGDRPPAIGAEALPTIDYLCRESREVFRLPAATTPPPNPKTGRTTLVPAVYDGKTKSWKPGPPLEVRQRARGRIGG